MPENTLLGRCLVAYEEAFEADDANGDEEPEDDWDSHPSLTAQQRNPTLQ
jgi:hypothetical protein